MTKNMNKKIIIGSIALLTGLAGIIASQKEAKLHDSMIESPSAILTKKTAPNYFTTFENNSKSRNEVNYDSLITSIKNQQKIFQQDYSVANDSVKKIIISEATNFVQDKLINDVFPAWYGTPWVFGGNASTPKENKESASRKESIDCGHFVTETLYDVGFNIEKNRLAQLASENIIKNLSEPDEIFRYRNKSIQAVNEQLDNLSEGLYITGLDCHTGFILNEKNNKRFIHSSYYPDQMQVVSEPIIGNNPFAHSKYRVLGKILDENMMDNWLTGKKFEVKYK